MGIALRNPPNFAVLLIGMARGCPAEQERFAQLFGT